MSPDVPPALEKLGPEASVVFGNDFLEGDEHARLRVLSLRRQLHSVGLEELGFGLSHDGRGWALVVRTNGATARHEALQAEFRRAFDTAD
jgi:hypothetical protein